MSLLLDALKKAAEEKQQGQQAAVPERAATPVADDGDTGQQMRNLLQGKGEALESDGFQPFTDADEATSTAVATGDAETAPVTEHAAAPLSFDLELLDDDEFEETDETPVNTAPAPTSLSSLTLMDEDEAVPFEVAVPAADMPVQAEPDASPETDTDEQVEPLAMQAPEPAVPGEPAEPAPAAPVTELQPEPEPESVAEPAATTVVAPEPDVAPEAEAAPMADAVPEATPAQTVPEQPAPVADAAETTGGDSMEALARQMGVQPGQSLYEPSPDRVLDALKRSKRRRRVLLVALLISAGLTAGGWGFLMYEEVMQQNDQLLSRYQPTVRKPVAPLPPATPVAETANTASAQATTATTVTTTTQTRLQQTTGQTAVVETVAPVAVPHTPETPRAAVETALKGDVSERTARRVETPLPSSGSTVLQTAGQVAPTASERVTIKRKTVTEGILEPSRTLDIASKASEARVMQAYRAFKQGDLALSQRLYSQALADDPFSRDAVMGLAAIAASQRDYARAGYYYRQLLDYDPADTAAFEGLIGLPDTGLDLVDIESRLRNYLARNPDSERAQARLGRTLARQKRWAEAQTAFFNAHRLNPNNAAHALNVAIALDHLRKYRTAKGYYEKVLSLSTAADNNTGLDLNTVRQRLDALSALEVK